MLTDQLYVVLLIKEEVFNLQVSVGNKNNLNNFHLSNQSPNL